MAQAINWRMAFVYLKIDWIGFLLQICRVEDIIVEGIVTGSVVHFHWVRTVVVHSSGAIIASGLGMTFASFVKNSHKITNQFMEFSIHKQNIFLWKHIFHSAIYYIVKFMFHS